MLRAPSHRYLPEIASRLFQLKREPIAVGVSKGLAPLARGMNMKLNEFCIHICRALAVSLRRYYRLHLICIKQHSVALADVAANIGACRLQSICIKLQHQNNSPKTLLSVLMDLDQFVQSVAPRKKRSRLLPYSGEIGLLKSRGYTDQQIQEWLSTVGVFVSREAVRKFAKSINTDEQYGLSIIQRYPKQEPTKAEKEINKSGSFQNKNAERIRLALAQQKHDAESKLFKHDNTGRTEGD